MYSHNIILYEENRYKMFLIRKKLFKTDFLEENKYIKKLVL